MIEWAKTKLLPWLPLAGILWGVVHFTVKATLNDFAMSTLVMKEQYIVNQQTQDRDGYRRDAKIEDLERRVRELEKTR